jgi:hypothetical protein
MRNLANCGITHSIGIKKRIKMRKYLLYIALILSIVMLISNIIDFDFHNLSNNSYAPIVSSFFFSVVFIILIRDKNNRIEKGK